MDKQKKMFRLIELWEQSGQNQSDFCASQGISLASFGYWRSKWLALDQPNGIVEPPLFMPIVKNESALKTPASTTLVYEITYPNGVRLSLPSLDLSILAQLLKLDVQS